MITILVTLSATLSMVINGLIIGQYLGADGLTAFGLSSPIFILMTAVAGVFSNGGTIRCATYLGHGNEQKVHNNFTVTMVVSLAVAIVLTLMCVLFSDPLAHILGAKGDYVKMTSGYIIGLGLAAIPFILSQNLVLYMRMDNAQRLSLIAIIVSIAANTAFAFYSATCTNLGLFGIGLSVAIGNFACLIVACLYFLKKNRKLKFNKMKDTKDELREITKSGLPTAINRGSQTLKNFSLNIYLMSFAGTAAVTALSIQTNVNQLLIAISMGYGLMIAMMCGIFFGEKDRIAMENTVRVALKSGIIVSTIVAIITIIFAPQIVGLFLKPEYDPSMSIDCVRLFILSQPTSTACLILLYFYQCTGRFGLANIISITRGFLYVFLLAIILAPIFGTNGVWMSFFFAELLSIVTILIVIGHKNGKMPRSIGDLLMLPDNFSDSKEIFNVSVKNDMNDVMNLAEKIENICIENGIDREKSARLSLCIEEMAGNIVEFAFDDGKQHFMDIRILTKDDDVIFRIRDDGKSFNPMEETSEEHFGIRVVRAVAKSIDYRNTVKLNNLTVVI